MASKVTSLLRQQPCHLHTWALGRGVDQARSQPSSGHRFARVKQIRTLVFHMPYSYVCTACVHAGGSRHADWDSPQHAGFRLAQFEIRLVCPDIRYFGGIAVVARFALLHWAITALIVL